MPAFNLYIITQYCNVTVPIPDKESGKQILYKEETTREGLESELGVEYILIHIRS
jgi:hypothetical protein